MTDQSPGQASADYEQRKRVRAGSRRGIKRERQVREQLNAEGWVAFRAPASLGVADVVALRAGHRPKMIEVKSTGGGPYERFGPADRAELTAAAIKAGADAILCHWPSYGQPRFIASKDWPST